MTDTTHKDSSTQGQFREVFEAELDAVRQRRAHNGISTGGDALDLPDFAEIKAAGKVSRLLENTLAELGISEDRNNWREARTVDGVEAGLVGVALSGGGIRSSTFNLGVLQAIHRAGLFRFVDYLSTVSGGGYIGTYLSTWMTARAEEGASQDTFPFVHQMGVQENSCFRHLRNHANYLAPEGRVELLSIPLVLLRGMFINALLILPYMMFAAAVMALLIVGIDTDAVAYSYNRDLWGEEGDTTPLDLWQNFTATGIFLLSLLAAFVSYPVLHTFRTVVLEKTDSDANTTRHRLMSLLRALLVLAILAFLFELQPLILQWMDTLTWPGTMMIFGVGTATAPLANKIINQLSELKAKLGAGFFGLVGVASLWVLLLRLTETADSIWTTLSVSTFTEPGPLAWALIMLGLWLYGALFVDMNALSVHKFYRDRLVAAFVARRPTEQSPNRDQVRGAKQGPVPRLSTLDTRSGPYHLLNATVNVKQVDERAKYKNGRRAGAFFFSPLYCGGNRSGYVSTLELERVEPNLDVGTAMAISGAAVTPNMGKFTNRWLAFAMAMLNVRLNYWIPSPKWIEKARTQGTTGLVRIAYGLRKKIGGVGPFYLFKEMMQWLSPKDKYLNLSDGGHIENLGVYELLRRQCRLIIAGDGEADRTLAFQGLAEVIRLARIDFGFDIEMQGLDEIRSGEQVWAVGTIHYSSTRTGKLIYIKSNLGGDYNLQATLVPDMYRSSSARDDNLLFDDNPYIAYYRQGNPDFPQESTADQSFDELQFESYRALGYQVAASALLAPPR